MQFVEVTEYNVIRIFDENRYRLETQITHISINREKSLTKRPLMHLRATAYLLTSVADMTALEMV